MPGSPPPREQLFEGVHGLDGRVDIDTFVEELPPESLGVPEIELFVAVGVELGRGALLLPLDLAESPVDLQARVREPSLREDFREAEPPDGVLEGLFVVLGAEVVVRLDLVGVFHAFYSGLLCRDLSL